MEETSYIIGGSFGLFLFVQYLLFYFFLRRSEESRRSKADILFILAVGVLIASYSAFGVMYLRGFPLPEWRYVFYKLKLVSGIAGLTFYVLLLRYFHQTIKDMAFVETDEYKSRSKVYQLGFFLFSLVISIVIFFVPFGDDTSRRPYFVFFVSLSVYLLIVGSIEWREFSAIMKKEKGKITPLGLVRYNTILVTGVVFILFWMSESMLVLSRQSGVITSFGSPYMYGVAVLCMGLSLNLLFEYMEALSRVSVSNRRLSELNRKIMEEVRTAQSLQISLLPLDKQKSIQKFMDMEISYMPMQSVGGDYYDFYSLDDDNRVVMLIGDASGHGIYAAMIWAMLKVEVEELIEEGHFSDLAQAFTTLNKRITRILENTYSYVTLFACTINRGRQDFHYISAGHTDQLYFTSRNRAVNRIRNKNPIIGTFKKAHFQSDSISYSPGDVILLFSDGVTEGANPEGEQLGLERLQDYFLSACMEMDSATGVISTLLMKVEEFYEGSLQKDDRTLVVIKL